MKYDELVKALRACARGVRMCDECYQDKDRFDCHTDLMKDAAAAIEALEHELNVQKNMLENLLMSSTESLIPKRGEWIVDGMYTYNLRELNGKAYEPVYRCSCCNRQMESYLRLDEPKMPEDADFPEFCPHCGARMDGGKNDKA